MTHNRKMRARAVWLTTTALSLMVAQTAYSQDAPGGSSVESVTVTGTQISGTKITGMVPVTVVDPAQIAAVGAVSGDDLFRSIPQMGNVNFNSNNGQVSSNFARGDIGSVDLRGLGEGNTLVLVNGRRVVTDPETQAGANSPVPVVTYNTNAIPVSDAERVEVLLDGAAALYGSDAVAGVANIITKKDLNGGHINLQYGGAESTHYNQAILDAEFGRDFAGGRGNITASFTYTQQASLLSTDQYFTSTADKTGLFANTAFAGSTSLDLRSTLSSWGTFAVIPVNTLVKSGTTAVTSASGGFHIQPVEDAGCAFTYASGVCIGTGSQATSGAGRNTRSDDQANYPLSITPSLNRYNFFATGHYDLNDNITAYAEIGFYDAVTHSTQDSVFSIGSILMTIPASNYWNPFGPTTFANGTANPNRLPNLNISAAGLPMSLSSYRFVDLGPSLVTDNSHQSRFVMGLKGRFLGFNWDSGLLYSEAANLDVGDGLSATKLQANLAMSTPDAYNPFSGGNPANPPGLDTSPSSQVALNSARVKQVTNDYSTLALWDLKASRNDLLTLPAGDVGIAAGVEVRHEFMSDNRDPTVDGTTTWTDTVLGVVQPSDQYGVSPSPDTRGDRYVESIYAELAIPLISPEMNIPLVRQVQAQVAGRYENFSDFDGTGKPKVAVSWDVIDGLRLRGSWSQGFEAPNLLQEHTQFLTRGNTNTDYIRCEADLRAHRIANFANCSESFVATSLRSGNPNLKPQTSDSKSMGIVFEPKFIPAEFGDFTFTADYWEVREKGIVGVFGSQNALTLDYLDRVNGTANPNVVRAAPTATDIALFAGTGITPVGAVTYVNDQYVNQNPQNARGLDLGLRWGLYNTGVGDFGVDINVARMIGLFLQPSPDVQQLLNARAAGAINAATSITGSANLLQQNSNPKMKWTATLTWRYGAWTVGGLVQYTGSVFDTGLADSSGHQYIVSPQLTGNLYAESKFDDGVLGTNTRVRFGVRNISNVSPPIFLNSTGYIGSMYQPFGRTWYVSVGKEF